MLTIDRLLKLCQFFASKSQAEANEYASKHQGLIEAVESTDHHNLSRQNEHVDNKLVDDWVAQQLASSSSELKGCYNDLCEIQ